jgi:NADPH:quinone reductase-like Zn-dependent oxidoreductase
VVNNRTDDIVAAARDATGGAGVDLVSDHVGPALFQASLLALRPRGRLVFCGATTGSEASFNLPHAYHFGMQLVGAGPSSSREFKAMLDRYWRGGFQPVIDSEYWLEDAAEAQRKLAFGDVLGRILLRP